MVLENRPTFAQDKSPGKYTSTMVRIWVIDDRLSLDGFFRFEHRKIIGNMTPPIHK
jgi:hypothetical protein